MPKENTAFLEKLRSHGSIPEAQFDTYIGRHKDSPFDLLRAVIEDGYVPKSTASQYWGDSIGKTYVDPFEVVISREAVDMIPYEIARKKTVLGLYRFGEVLTVLMADPNDTTFINQLERITQGPVSPLFGLPWEIETAISIQYQTRKSLDELLENVTKSGFNLQITSGEHVAMMAEALPVTELFDAMLFHSLRERASDIHIQPQEDYVPVRIRVDGHLREIIRLPKSLAGAIAARVKVMSDLDVSERRLPQDGRFSFDLGGNTANFRVSVMPSIHGEKVVIRILNISGVRQVMELDRMAILNSVLQPFRRLIRRPNGIIFITGPTGSGKTTTLYGALEDINDPGQNIVTIEDPVEYQLKGLTQVQVKPDIGLTFNRVLRATMRQDPDVILVGEIRDLETAKIASEAALTGHLVFATLHTNNAIQATVRLIDLGVEPFIVAPSILGVVSQRLAARICENCREPYHPALSELKRHFLDEGIEKVPFYRGAGCSECGKSGYRGRVALHELVVITDEMRAMISAGATMTDLARAAKKVGYRPMRYDGLKKVLLGLTTIEEVERITVEEMPV